MRTFALSADIETYRFALIVLSLVLLFAIGIIAALICMLPGIGVLDPRTFESGTSFSTLFYVAGLLGMVSLFDASGLAGVLGARALDWLPLAPDAPAISFGALVGAAALISLVTTHPGVPAVLGPLAAPLAEAGNLPLETVLMTQVVGFAAMLLPHQSAPVMVALQLAGIRWGPPPGSACCSARSRCWCSCRSTTSGGAGSAISTNTLWLLNLLQCTLESHSPCAG